MCPVQIQTGSQIFAFKCTDLRGFLFAFIRFFLGAMGARASPGSIGNEIFFWGSILIDKTPGPVASFRKADYSSAGSRKTSDRLCLLMFTCTVQSFRPCSTVFCFPFVPRFVPVFRLRTINYRVTGVFVILLGPVVAPLWATGQEVSLSVPQVSQAVRHDTSFPLRDRTVKIPQPWRGSSSPHPDTSRPSRQAQAERSDGGSCASNRICPEPERNFNPPADTKLRRPVRRRQQRCAWLSRGAARH